MDTARLMKKKKKKKQQRKEKEKKKNSLSPDLSVNLTNEADV